MSVIEAWEKLREEGRTIQSAPFSFAFVCLVIIAISWAGFHSVYRELLDHANESSSHWKSESDYWKDVASRAPTIRWSEDGSVPPPPKSSKRMDTHAIAGGQSNGSSSAVPPAVILPQGTRIEAVTRAPNSAAVGINTGTINVNAPWTIPDQMLQAIVEVESRYVRTDDRGDFITCVMGDADSTRVAVSLVGAFRKAGWKLPGSGFSQAMYDNPPTGIIFLKHDIHANPPGMVELIRIFRAAGIEPAGRLNEHVPVNEFQLIIGYKPVS